MIITGIDPGLRSVGICDYNTETKLFRFFCIQPILKERAAALHELQDGIRDYIFHTGFPGVAAIEDYAYSRSGSSRTITACAEAGGVIKAEFGAYCHGVLEISSSWWKKAVGWETLPKKSKREQEEYINTCYEKFGVRLQNPDICDAYMITRSLYALYKINPKAFNDRESANEYIRRVYGKK